MKRSPALRILDHVAFDPETKCWLWTGPLRPDGYVQMSVKGRLEYAHRVSYEAYVGPIPEGLTLDHLCRTPRCVNPDHLDPVTHLENCQRGSHATKTHCRHGHAYTPGNTLQGSKGERKCRECNRVNQQRYKLKLRIAA